MKKWHWVLGSVVITAIILTLIIFVFPTTGTGSVSNYYLIPAGTYTPFHNPDIPLTPGTPAAGSTPVAPQPISPANASSVQSGSSGLVIAFQSDNLSSSSWEAITMFRRGQTLSTQYGRYNESLWYFDQALRITPGFTEAWLEKGVALHNMKRYDDALTCYDRALAITPGDAAVWYLKGITFRDSGREKESAACFLKASELDSRYRAI
ncbi:MAG: tetratricopeptide repeat protein [Methanoregula sp.]|nr:tetratricopeptide repeat protein [Methanoregula sp.]